jgi:Na+-transporting NADH:ubiquinone oxidoreductase subunit E
MHLDFTSLFLLFIASITVQNMLLANFLGLCPFVAVSTEIPTSLGMGFAVIFVMFMAVLLVWPINHLILVPLHLEYLQFIIYIMIVASFVQIVELFIDRFSPVLYFALGVFLPLITVNCAVLGVLLISTLRDYGYAQSLVYALGSGIGWLIAIVAMGGIRQKLAFSSIPKGLQGPGITMITAGIMAMAFMGFAGIINL